MAGMIVNERLKDYNNVRTQPEKLGDPLERPSVQFDKFDDVNQMWICQACYMDGTTTNGGDCKCEGCCATNCSPTYNYDERKKQTIPTYIWIIMGALGAALLILVVSLASVSALQATGAATSPPSLVNNPGTSFDLDNQWQIFKSVGPTQPANWVKSGNQAKFGQWPTYVWDPTLAPKGPLFPGRMNSVRLELTWGAYTPSSTGGALGMKIRMIIPNHWYNTKTRPWNPYYTATCSIGGFLDIGSKGKDVTQQYFDLFVPGYAFPNGTNQQYPFDLYKTNIDISCNYKSTSLPTNAPGYTGPLNFFVAIDPSNIGFFQSSMIAARPQITTTENVVLVQTPPAKATTNYKTPVSTPTAMANSPTPIPGSGGKTWLQLYCASVIKAMGLVAGNAACAAKATSGAFSRRRGRKLISSGDPGTVISLSITAPQTSTFALVDKLTTACASGAVTQAFTSVAPQMAFTIGTPAPGIVSRSGVPNTDDGNSPTNDDLSKAAATDDGGAGDKPAPIQSTAPTLKPVLPAGTTGKPSFQPTSTYFVKTRAPSQPIVITTPPTAAGYTPPPTIRGQTNAPSFGYGIAPAAPNDDTLNFLYAKKRTSGIANAVPNDDQVAQLLGITPVPEPIAAPVGAPIPSVPISFGAPLSVPTISVPTAQFAPSSPLPQFSPSVLLGPTNFPPAFLLAPISAPTTRRNRGMSATTENISDIDEMEATVEEEEQEEEVDESPVWRKHEGRYIRVYEEGHEEMPEGFQLGQYNEKGEFVTHTEGSRERAPFESDGVMMSGRIINHDVRGEDLVTKTIHMMAGSVPAPSPTQKAPTNVQRALDGFVSPTNPLTPGVPTPALVPGYQLYIQTDFVVAPFRLNMTLQRVPINIVFPMFLLAVMWLMVVGQLLAYLPFFLRIKPVDAWSMATSAGPLIFALTGVRNTMPGAPPVGVVMDFTTYYWCLAIIIFNHVYLGVNWALFSLLRPQREKALKARMEEAKRLEQKALTNCSVDEIVRLFESGKRDTLVPFIKEKKIDGKLLKLAGQSEKALTECGFDVTGLAKWKLLNEIDGWIKDGVDRKKIEKVVETPKDPVPAAPLTGSGWYSFA